MAQQRAVRVAEQLHKELADLIRKDVRDPRVGLVSITHIELNPDLTLATIHVCQLGGVIELGQVPGGVGRPLVPLDGILFEQSSEPLVEPTWQCQGRLERRRRAAEVTIRNLQPRLPTKRGAACDQAVDHAAKCVQVRPRTDIARVTHELFGCHVRRRSTHASRGRGQGQA